LPAKVFPVAGLLAVASLLPEDPVDVRRLPVNFAPALDGFGLRLSLAFSECVTFDMTVLAIEKASIGRYIKQIK
jgi:hypothetical protein